MFGPLAQLRRIREKAAYFDVDVGFLRRGQLRGGSGAVLQPPNTDPGPIRVWALAAAFAGCFSIAPSAARTRSHARSYF